MHTLTFNSGMRLLSQRQYQALYDSALSALKRNEKDPLAFFFLGLVASENGHGGKAVEFHAKAAQNGPRSFRYQVFYAKALLGTGDAAAAKIQADKAALLRCDDALLADMLGVVYSRTGHHDQAVPWFKKAVSLNPNWPEFQFNLGASAQFIGDFKTAKAAYTACLALEPKFYQAWFALVGLDKQSPADNHLDDLKPLFARVSGDAEAQLLLGHSIAKTYEDIGEYPQSLEWLHKAKSAKAAQVHYSKRDTEALFANTMSRAQSREKAPSLNVGAAPIFVVGMPRTGTTLIDRILSSHQDVASVGEPEWIEALLRQSLAAEHIRSAYIERTHGLTGGAARPIDKTPLNFLYADIISQAFPEARIIAVRRGAMDTCLSNYRQMFAAHRNQYNYSYDLLDTAHYYRQFDHLTSHWRETLPKDRFTEIRYESMVGDQENQTRRLLAFCGLEWDAACLRFHENAAPSDTASSVQVRQPLNADSIDRWKKYGGALSDLRAALGDLA